VTIAVFCFQNVPVIVGSDRLRMLPISYSLSASYLPYVRGGADKFLARPGRKQDTAT
jgi:hypothetical protein